MIVLGLQGSPRPKGNTGVLLSAFLDEVQNAGGRVHYLDVPKKKIAPCMECRTCEKKGYCPIDDDMQDIYAMLRQADVIAMATPIFFYGPTAQLKSLIDRSQALWARKYTHGLTDPGRKWRKGFLLAVGATKGKNLFDGTNLTARYFFDAVGAHFDGTLGYREVEEIGDIEKHPTALEDAREVARTLVAPFVQRRRILFVCRENACRSQMASAFAQYRYGGKIQVESAGSAPAPKINAIMEEAMKEKGIDMAFRKPRSTEALAGVERPDLVISMGCGDACPTFPDAPVEDWDLEDPAGKPLAFMREVRDDIEKRVGELVGNLKLET